MKLLDKLLAFMFSRTQVDETIETILGNVLEQVERLQELAKVYEGKSQGHFDVAAEATKQGVELAAKAERADRVALKFKKLLD